MKVAIGLSGGVDSAVAAFLLKQQGYKVVGIYLSAWCNDQSLLDQQMAEQIAKFLKIKFQVLDIKKDYEARVIDYFYQEYHKGRVPSPDVICNRDIKFGLFLDWVIDHKFDKLATGHYALLKSNKENGQLAIYRSKDKTKDQTYFLFQLTEDKLNRILWPLSNLTKKQVRSIASEHNFPNKDRQDSMGICFVGEINLVDFLKQRIKPKMGQIVLANGQIVGEHKGVWFYTLGQRHGFKITKPQLIPDEYLDQKGLKPLYVIGKDVEKNRLIVSIKQDCYIDTLKASSVTTIRSNEDINNRTLKFRLTNLGPLLSGNISKQRDGSYVIKLSQPTLITSPGQPVVFYDSDDRLIGGGIIEAVG